MSMPQQLLVKKCKDIPYIKRNDAKEKSSVTQRPWDMSVSKSLGGENIDSRSRIWLMMLKEKQWLSDSRCLRATIIFSLTTFFITFDLFSWDTNTFHDKKNIWCENTRWDHVLDTQNVLLKQWKWKSVPVVVKEGALNLSMFLSMNRCPYAMLVCSGHAVSTFSVGYSFSFSTNLPEWTSYIEVKQFLSSIWTCVSHSLVRG